MDFGSIETNLIAKMKAGWTSSSAAFNQDLFTLAAEQWLVFTEYFMKSVAIKHILMLQRTFFESNKKYIFTNCQCIFCLWNCLDSSVSNRK